MKKILAAVGIMMSPFAGLMGSGTGAAHASPYPATEIAICNQLAANPTEAGIGRFFDGVGQLIRNGQTTADEYAVITADAINNRCPEYWPMVATYMANHPATPKPRHEMT